MPAVPGKTFTGLGHERWCDAVLDAKGFDHVPGEMLATVVFAHAP